MSGGNMQFRIASGFNTSGASNSKLLLAARIWFKDVIIVDNPELAELEPRINLLRNQVQDIYRNQLLMRRNRDFEDFPQTFTDLTEDQLIVFEQIMVFRQMVAQKNEFVRLKYEYDNLRFSVHAKVYWR